MQFDYFPRDRVLPTGPTEVWTKFDISIHGFIPSMPRTFAVPILIFLYLFLVHQIPQTLRGPLMQRAPLFVPVHETVTRMWATLYLMATYIQHQYIHAIVQILCTRSRPARHV